MRYKLFNFIFLFACYCDVFGIPAYTKISDIENLYVFTDKLNYRIDDSSSIFSIQNLNFNTGYPTLDEKLAHTSWYHISVVNATNEKLLIGLDNPHIDSLTFYFINKGKIIDSIQLGDSWAFNTRKYKERYFLADIPAGLDSINIYIKVNLKELIDIPVFIGTKDAFHFAQKKEDVFAGFIAGAVILMVIYNLFIFFSTKEIGYLLYAVSQLFALYVIMGLSGYPFMLFHPDFPALNNNFAVFVALNSISSMLFYYFFLQMKKYAPQWVKVFEGIIVGDILVIGLNLSQNYSQASLLYELLTIVNILALYITAVLVIRKGYSPAIYFLIGYGTYSGAAILYILYNLNVVPATFPVIKIFHLSLLVEAALMSLALADKLNFYRSENDRIMKNQNEFLEKSVIERTKELNSAYQEQETINEELSMVNEELSVTLETIEKEQQKSEKLLLNILPSAVAGELKETGKASPKFYNNVTVIFADLVNFTHFAEKHSPEEIIKQLDPLFLSFDLICQKYKLEKIKTIGDCYMAAGGLPIENTTNALDAVHAAVEMLKLIEDMGWELRIGIHTGPVVAGVVGINKFAYDVWGDAVNIASRMEQHSEPNKINISKETFHLVKEHFKCVHRGKVAAKHKGDIDMYFVEVD